jgi:chemotaxis protein histidine kinase CheA
MAGKIFISYRRDDSRYQAQRIYEAFLRGLPRENIFMDVDAIPLGVDFAKVLEGWLDQCDVLLVLMGAGWANSTDSKTGRRRLDNQKDFVRVEIRAALTRDIPVVPVLLDRAELPEEAELPDDIKGLLNRNAEFVEYRTFDADVQRLIRKLGVGGSTKRGASPAIIAGTQRDQAIEEHDSRSSAESLEAQGDLADKLREKKPLVKEWTKGWLTPTIVATVLLAAAAGGILAFWSPGLLSGKRVEITAKGADSARQAAEARAVEAEKARQVAEAKTADAEKARQAAEARAADAEKARQVAEAKTADAEKARQAAEASATDAEKARQTAQAQSANAEKSRQAAEAKLADAENARRAAEANAPATVTSSLFTRRTNFEAQGRRLDSFIPDVASVSICEQYCARSSRCNAFAYNKTNRDCYKYAVFWLVPNVHYDSGIRQQAISPIPEVEPTWIR